MQGYLAIGAAHAALAAAQVTARAELGAAATLAPPPTTLAVPTAAAALATATLAVGSQAVLRTERMLAALYPEGDAGTAPEVVTVLAARDELTQRAERVALTAVAVAAGKADVAPATVPPAALAADTAAWLQQCLAAEVHTALQLVRKSEAAAQGAALVHGRGGSILRRYVEGSGAGATAADVAAALEPHSLASVLADLKCASSFLLTVAPLMFGNFS